MKIYMLHLAPDPDSWSHTVEDNLESARVAALEAGFDTYVYDWMYNVNTKTATDPVHVASCIDGIWKLHE